MKTLPSQCSRQALPWLAGVAASFLLSPLTAEDLFQLNGSTTDAGPPVNFHETSNQLVDFVNNLVAGSGQFQSLQNRQFQAALRYAGVENALTFNVQQVGPEWRANLVSAFNPEIIQQNFTAFSRQELEHQVETYVKKDGLGDLAKFMNAMNQRTVAGVLDGNPSAATAQISEVSFMEYALRPTSTAEEQEAEEGQGDEEKSTSRAGIGMTADVGTFRSQGLEGRSFSWTPMLPIALGKARRVRLELSLPLNYTQIEGADTYRVGTQVGVAVLVVKRTKEQPWLWQVTPHGGVTAAGSIDLAAGGLVASGGLTSYASYRWGAWEFSMGNQVGFHEGLRVDIDDYTFDPQLSQRIYKNGVKVGRSISQRWYAEAYVIDTEFEREAFVSRYLTVGAGVGYRGIKKKGYLMIGGYTDLGEDYQSAHFRVGTGWKF